MKKFLAMLMLAALLTTALAGFQTALAEGGTIVYSIQGDPEEMDPGLNSYARSSLVLQNLFKGLYKFASDGKSYVPALAESCDVSEDGLTYTFHLREGLLWSDGTPLNAHDFEYSWKRVLNPEVASRAASDLWILKNGQAYNQGAAAQEDVGVKATDDLTLVCELETLAPWFVSMTATTAFMPVKKDIVEGSEAWTKTPDTYVSNGPFMLAEYSSLSHLTLVPNPNYYLAGEIQIDGVKIVIIPDKATELTAYNNGEINVSDELSPDALKQYAGSDEFFTSGKIGIQYCDFNCSLPEFSDKRVRQAFAMAIDRQAVLNVLGLVEKPVYGFVPYSQPSLSTEGASYRDIAGDMFKEDPEAAKALLAEAGYPNGENFPVVEIVTKNDNEQKLMAQVIGEMWKANLGVEYSITTYESAVYWDELAAGHFSTDRNGYTCDYVDPSANLKIWVTGSNASENQWDDPVYDGMFAEAGKITDPAEREAKLIEIEKYLVDQMPGMPMYSYEDPYLIKPDIKGIVKNPIGHIYFEYAHFE